MSSEPKTDEVLKYLVKERTRKELEEKFSLSNTQSYHLINWLKKAKLVIEERRRVANQTNWQWFYKSK